MKKIITQIKLLCYKIYIYEKIYRNILFSIYFIKYKNNFYDIYLQWGLGIGDWGLGIGPNPQSPFLIYFI